MIGQSIKQAVVIAKDLDPTRPYDYLALFDEQGQPIDIGEVGGGGSNKFEIVIPLNPSIIPFAMFDKSQYDGYTSIVWRTLLGVQAAGPEAGTVTATLNTGMAFLDPDLAPIDGSDLVFTGQNTDAWPVDVLTSGDISDELPNEPVGLIVTIATIDDDSVWSDYRFPALLVRFGES